MSARRAGSWMSVLCAIGLAALTSPAQGATYTARVIAITDGDTLQARHEGRDFTVRLRWIDAPEKGQPYSDKATRALTDMVAGRNVIVRDYGADRNGHRLAEVVLADGRNLNRELVRLGWAWWFRKYSSDVSLGTLEAAARAAGRGLWADTRPIPPWEWRVSRAPRT